MGKIVRTPTRAEVGNHAERMARLAERLLQLLQKLYFFLYS